MTMETAQKFTHRECRSGIPVTTKRARMYRDLKKNPAERRFRLLMQTCRVVNIRRVSGS